MARLIAALVRHGDYHQLPQTPSAHQPYPLNAEGQAQALGGAQILHDLIVAHHWSLVPEIDSSRMLRAWQTAEVFALRLKELACAGACVTSYDALAERGVGSLANLSISQIENLLEQDPRFSSPPVNWKADSHYRLPAQGAESLLQAGQRVAAHLVQSMAPLKRDHRDRIKLFVGHGAAFRHAAHHLGVLALERVAQLSMFHGQPVLLEYLPDQSWTHIGGEWKRRSVDNLPPD